MAEHRGEDRLAENGSSAETPAPAHVHAVRVYYEDTDAAGIVYHAAHLRFAERARTEWLRALGEEHSRLLADYGIVFTVRRCEIDYLAPARLDDLLEVETRTVALGGASLVLDQTIRRAGEADAVARLRLRLACLARDGRPARFPPRLRALLAHSVSQGA